VNESIFRRDQQALHLMKRWAWAEFTKRVLPCHREFDN
jgi:hypothetical protein